MKKRECWYHFVGLVFLLVFGVAVNAQTLYSSGKMASDLASLQRLNLRVQALRYLADERSESVFNELLEKMAPKEQVGFVMNVKGALTGSNLERYARTIDGVSDQIFKKLATLPASEAMARVKDIVTLVELRLNRNQVQTLSYKPLVERLYRQYLSERVSLASGVDASKRQAISTRLGKLNATLDDLGRSDLYAVLKRQFDNGNEPLNPRWFDGSLNDLRPTAGEAKQGREIVDLSRAQAIDGEVLQSVDVRDGPRSPAKGNPFFWGVSTSGYQWEGKSINSAWIAHENAGKSPEKCGLAANGLKTYAGDAALAAGLGCNAFRTSIEWDRIEPVRGKIDPAGVAFYHRLFQALRKKGLTPLVTLVHFSWPRWLDTELGGWQDQRSIEAFCRYVEFVSREYGKEVDWWLTFNEPVVLIPAGYVTGQLPPGLKNPFTAAMVAANWITCHKKAYEIIHAIDPVSFVSFNNYAGTYSFFGANIIFFDQEGAPGPQISEGENTGSAEDPTAGLGVSGKGKKRYLDYIALDYYCRWNLPGGFKTPHIWEIYPDGFYECLKNYYRVFKLPVLVAENGLATNDLALRADGWTRESFLVQHIKQMQRAMNEGIPVIGYFHWSLTDNFELGSFSPRFGLYSVECKKGDFRRTPTNAAAVYRKIIAANGVTSELEAAYPPPVSPTKKGK